MTKSSRVAVTSRSFSRHPVLREELSARFKAVTFNDAGVSLRDSALIDFLKGHDMAITALEKLDGGVFDALPDLRVISKYGVGFDALDIDAMVQRGIKLGWQDGVNKRSVSELVIAYAITFLRHIRGLNQNLRDETWQPVTGATLSGRTVGIIGCGHVGKDLAILLRALDCRVLAHDLLDFTEFYRRHDIEAVGLDSLLRQADIVTLHLPLDRSTRNILNAERLALMRANAYLINAARGGLVDEFALKKQLEQNRLAGAAFDVFAVEPPEDWGLIKLPNFIATPHIGGSTEEAILAMGRAAIEGLKTARVPNADWPPRA